MSGYVKIFKDKDGDKDKNKNDELMSFCIDDEKLLEKYEFIWSKIEDLQNIALNALQIDDGRYIKTKLRTYGDKVYINFHSLNVVQDGVECESFTTISIYCLVVYGNITCKYI